MERSNHKQCNFGIAVFTWDITSRMPFLLPAILGFEADRHLGCFKDVIRLSLSYQKTTDLLLF